MKNYYYKLEISNINPDLSGSFKDHFSLINNCNQIELQSKYFPTEISCIESLLQDFGMKVSKLEDLHPTILFPKVSSENPILYEDMKLEDLEENYRDFWTDSKLRVFCLIDQDNDTFFLRYTVYQEEDSIIFKESLEDYNYIYPDFNNNNYIQ